MRDPFAPESNSSFLRDAQVGLLLVAVLLGLFVYVAYYRITGKGRPLPEHVRMAPIAEAVWPHGPPGNQTYEAPHSTEPTHVVAPRHPSPRRVTNPASPAQTVSSSSSTPNKKTFSVRPVPPTPLRTDRHVTPVDFQKAATNEKARQAKPSSGSGFRVGEKIDATKIRKREPATYQNVFGGDGKPLTTKIVKPEVKLPEIKLPVSSAPAGLENKTAKPAVLSPAKKPKLNSFQPTISAFGQPKKQLPDVKAFEPVKAVAENKTEFSSSVGTNSVDTNDLRPAANQPRMMPSKPVVHPMPKQSTPKHLEPKETDNSFQPLGGSFQSTIKQPVREQAVVKQPVTSQFDLSPQQDIAKSSRKPTLPTAKKLPAADMASDIALVDTRAFQGSGKKPQWNQAQLTPSPPTAPPASPTFKAPDQFGSVYVTKKGDSFWSIATEHYGDGRLFDALYRWNRKRTESYDDLPEATELETPKKVELVRRWPDLCPQDDTPTQSQSFDDQTVASYDVSLTERLYTTREGDTLFEIAANKLGQASRYVDIIAKNDQRLPSDVNHSVPLEAGLRLVLPD